MKVNHGLNIFKIDEKNLESAPEEIRFMMELAREIVANTVKNCQQENMNPSVLPSSYLQAFKIFFPTMLKIVREEGDGPSEGFIDAHVMSLHEVIKYIEKMKK